MLCPACKDVNLVMADRSGVEIDHCPTCRGVWLDRGELDKILERSAAETPDSGRYGAAPRHGHHDDHKHHGHHGYHGRRKSWLGELFD